ncbi:hypothetical protein ACFO9E_00745 [Streptomyces maoxianensis]|uniref:Uncharacterized protein n=1 Tax=Streptomyces maoxianensis TaxID=1459942 RepID=A0ABV9FWF8_9ACTN
MTSATAVLLSAAGRAGHAAATVATSARGVGHGSSRGSDVGSGSRIALGVFGVIIVAGLGPFAYAIRMPRRGGGTRPRPL